MTRVVGGLVSRGSTPLPTWPLVIVFEMEGLGGGDKMCGWHRGSRESSGAKVTCFTLPIFLLSLVAPPGGMEISCWPFRSTRKYIPCEFFLFARVPTHFLARRAQNARHFHMAFFLPHKVLVRHPFFAYLGQNVRVEIELSHPPKEDAFLHMGRENFLDARLRLPYPLSLRIPTQ